MNVLTADCNVTILLLFMSTVPYRLLCNTNSTLLYLFSRDLSKEHFEKCRTAHTTLHHATSHYNIQHYIKTSQYHVTSHHTK